MLHPDANSNEGLFMRQVTKCMMLRTERVK